MRHVALLVVLAVLGCSSNEPRSQVTNYETRGNLEAKAPLACVPLSEVTNQHTPADIYPGVAACIKLGAYEKAVPLYALAGTFGRFDQLRVADATARQAIQVLQMNNFGDLTKEQQDGFKKVMLPALDAGSPSFASTCAAIRRFGPPQYVPTYMVQHGMSAFLGPSGNGVKSDFDPAKGWQDALSGYLHCP
jgi:hypothetical protein